MTNFFLSWLFTFIFDVILLFSILITVLLYILLPFVNAPFMSISSSLSSPRCFLFPSLSLSCITIPLNSMFFQNTGNQGSIKISFSLSGNCHAFLDSPVWNFPSLRPKDRVPCLLTCYLTCRCGEKRWNCAKVKATGQTCFCIQLANTILITNN